MSKTNLTKIKYIIISDKLYEVQHLSFSDLLLSAALCDKSISDVPPEEIFPLDDFGEFRVKLINGCGQAEIVNFAEWKKRKAV